MTLTKRIVTRTAWCEVRGDGLWQKPTEPLNVALIDRVTSPYDRGVKRRIRGVD